MKLKNSSCKEQGSALMVTIVVVTVIGITLGSYLGMVSAQNRYSMRSQAWNRALPVLEAGIEEALTQLYHNPTNRSANGWIFTNNVYLKERMLGDSKYVVTISDTSPPDIIARGYVLAPLSTNYMDPPRTVRVTTTMDGLFARGMVAKGQI
jgi:hypothetical protein